MYKQELDKILYKEKFRIKSTRLPNWDYSNDGWYFITICTKKMVNHFGEVRNFVMGLNEIGCIATKYWQEIPNHFKNVRLDEWVIMPNHVHGIIIIDKPQNDITSTVGTGDWGEAIDKPQNDITSIVGAGDWGEAIDKPQSSSIQRRDAINRVSTGGVTRCHNPMGKGSLGEIIRWFKGRTVFEIHKKYPNFQWQSRFYDHIITNDKELLKIQEYIYYNPQMWDRDRNNH
ncbi:hypothetical protein JW758_03500 [Candidatus Peregrinibacteria bacterium]|nr:hypothetical protein [Candidatus Peregrinibacteria bacterium]